MSKILIIGAGAMGTAFSIPCVDNGHSVALIGSPLEDKLIEKLNKGRRFYQTLDCYLPKKLNKSTPIEEPTTPPTSKTVPILKSTLLLFQ